jgi:hypothetical protein
MADNGISKDEMADLFERYMGGKSGGGKGYDPNDLDSFTKSLKRSTEELKKSQPGFKGLQDFLSGVKTSKDAFNGLREQLDNLDDQIEKTAKSTKDGAISSENVAKVSALNAQKRELAQAAAAKASKAAFGNLAIGVGEFAASMAEGAVSFVKGLQDGASGSQLATDAAKNFAKSGADAASSVAGFGQSIGMVMTLIGGPWVKAIGAAIEVLGMFVDFFAKKGGKAAAEAAELLGKELQKTQKGFKDITEAGAVFGGGMTEMRKTAAEAGLDIAQLAIVVKGSREDLAMMGIGAGEATKRLAGVSKELRNSELGIQLRKLGYTAEEQAELSAAVMANMNAAGDKRAANDRLVAQETQQYGKDLKVLADVTGQDAKKAMDKARTQAMEADLLAQAQAEGGAEAVEKLQRQLATMPEAMKKGYMEFVSTGGTAIADSATNVAITQNPKIMEQYRAQYAALKDHNIDASKAQDQTSKLTEETAQYQRDQVKNQRSMAVATRLSSDSVSGGVKGAVDIQNALIMTNAKMQKGATQGARDAANKAAENLSPLDEASARLEENTQKLKAALGKELTDAVTGFAEAASKGLETLDGALSKFGVETKGGAAKRVAVAVAAQASGAGGQRSSGTVGAGSAMVGGAGGEGDAGAIMEAAGSGGPLKSSALDLLKFTPRTGDKAHFDQLDPTFKERFMNMIAEYGVPVTVSSGFRSPEEQAAVKKAGGIMAADPGKSRHQRGSAIDLAESDVVSLKTMGLLQKYGFQGVNGDPVHIQMAANGASLGSNDLAIVGETGPELVQGPGSVTSRADTSELFKSMNNNIEAMLRVLKDHKDISEKTLWATS